MNVQVKGVHFDVNQNTHDRIEKKLKRLGYAEDLIVDLLITLTHDTHGYKIEATLNFKWGNSSHVGLDSYNLLQGIDILFDKLDIKINKEKDKIQDHKSTTL